MAKTDLAEKAGLPYADTPITRYLTREIDRIGQMKTQREIALELGYPKPNMVSMIKRGESRLPLDKIPALARAINVDPGHLFRLAVHTYHPELKELIDQVFNGSVISTNEIKLVDEWRAVTKNTDPIIGPEVKRKMQENFSVFANV